MPSLTIGQPSERQKLFLTADKKYIGFGGASPVVVARVGQ